MAKVNIVLQGGFGAAEEFIAAGDYPISLSSAYGTALYENATPTQGEVPVTTVNIKNPVEELLYYTEGTGVAKARLVFESGTVAAINDVQFRRSFMDGTTQKYYGVIEDATNGVATLSKLPITSVSITINVTTIPLGYELVDQTKTTITQLITDGDNFFDFVVRDLTKQSARVYNRAAIIYDSIDTTTPANPIAFEGIEGTLSIDTTVNP